MTPGDFVEALRELCPGPRSVVDEHLSDHGDVLLHLLTADLRRLLLAAFKQGDDEFLQRSFALLDRALRTGDEELRNAVAVSFVEDAGWSDPSMRAFIDSWPPGLRDEAERQQRWFPARPLPTAKGAESTRTGATPEAVAFETLGFECAYTVEIDPEFPGDGDWGCAVVGFDRTGAVMQEFDSRWGTPFVARTRPDSGQDWVAMFEAGGLGSLRGVFATPSPHLFAVVVDGLAYLVDSRSPGLRAEIAQDQVHQVEPCHDPPLVLFAGFIDLVAIGPDGVAWKTPRLCVDGLEVHHAGRNGIDCSCDGYEGTRAITLDPRTGALVEGTPRRAE